MKQPSWNAVKTAFLQMAETWRQRLSRIAGGHVLGPLEAEVMAIFWKRGPSSVHEVVHSLLPGKIAYTTVLTTVARLSEQGLLQKQAQRGRGFIFAPTGTEQEWQVLASQEAVKRFLATPNVPLHLLLSSLQEALNVQPE